MDCNVLAIKFKANYAARYNALDLDMFCSLQQYGGAIQAEDRRNSQKLLKDPINGGFFWLQAYCLSI